MFPVDLDFPCDQGRRQPRPWSDGGTHPASSSSAVHEIIRPVLPSTWSEISSAGADSQEPRRHRGGELLPEETLKVGTNMEGG
jgi:hypothetical protein